MMIPLFNHKVHYHPSYFLLFLLLFCGILPGQTSVVDKGPATFDESAVFNLWKIPSEGLRLATIDSIINHSDGMRQFSALIAKADYYDSMGNDSLFLLYEKALAKGEALGIDQDTLNIGRYRSSIAYSKSGNLNFAELILDKILTETSESDYAYWLARFKKNLVSQTKNEWNSLKKTLDNVLLYRLEREQFLFLVKISTPYDRSFSLDHLMEYQDIVKQSNDYSLQLQYWTECINFAKVYMHIKPLNQLFSLAESAYQRIPNKSFNDHYFYNYVMSMKYARKGEHLKAYEYTATNCLVHGST